MTDLVRDDIVLSMACTVADGCGLTVSYMLTRPQSLTAAA